MLHSHHGPEASDLSTPRTALHLRAVLALPPPTVLIAAGAYSPVAFVRLAPGTSWHVFHEVDASRPHISGTPTAGCYDIPPRPHAADPSVHLRPRSHRLIAILRLRLDDLCEEGRAQGLSRSHARVVRPEPSLQPADRHPNFTRCIEIAVQLLMTVNLQLLSPQTGHLCRGRCCARLIFLYN